MTPAAEPAVDLRLGLRGERGRVLLAVMLSTGLVAIDATILAAAVPAVVDDLGGLTQFPWLFSVYLLAQAVSMPIYGKLSDLVGRKRIMLVGVGLFVVGSLLCGVAWSMGSLIAFRALQGLGAGAVQPVGMTILGDIYSVAERAKVQGYVGLVWAAASLVGPILGGAFADYLSWRWIFLVNLPLGALATWMLWTRFTEHRTAREPGTPRPRIDVTGSVLLTLGTIALLVALLEGGVVWAWASPQSIGLLVAAAVLLGAFGVVEHRAAEPVLPLWVFRHRVVGAAMALLFFVGVLLFGLSSYVPLYSQGVLGTGAIVAGLALGALTIGWPIAAAAAGRIYLKFGFRLTVLLGSALAIVGASLLLVLDASSSPLHLALASFVVGLGFGWVASPAVIAAQASVGWEDRGVATSATMFARSIGSAIGVAVFGAIANSVVRGGLGHKPERLDTVPPAVLGPAVETVFHLSFAAAVALVLVAFLMPRDVQEIVDTPSRRRA